MIRYICSPRYVRLDTESLSPEVLDVPSYLRFKERLAGVAPSSEPWVLEVDLGPFEARFPKMTRSCPSRALSRFL